jgi:heme exporter protein D
MSYFEYVAAAYAVFAVVLAWDFVAPKLLLRQQLRAAKLRVAREAAAKKKDTGSPLSRG